MQRTKYSFKLPVQELGTYFFVENWKGTPLYVIFLRITSGRDAEDVFMYSGDDKEAFENRMIRYIESYKCSNVNYLYYVCLENNWRVVAKYYFNHYKDTLTTQRMYTTSDLDTIAVCIRNNNLEDLKQLVDLGWDFNKFKGKTCLEQALTKPEILEFLYSHGMKINQRTISSIGIQSLWGVYHRLNSIKRIEKRYRDYLLTYYKEV